jgi:hypothetical protein
MKVLWERGPLVASEIVGSFHQELGEEWFR